MTSYDRHANRSNNPFGELCADAPIAAIDYDSVSSGSRPPDHHRVLSHEYSNTSLQSLDFDVPFRGSLSDLVLNFEERLGASEYPDGDDDDVDTTKNTKLTLSQVKLWWTEATDRFNTTDYPLGGMPDKLGPYDDLEPMDADGITENSDFVEKLDSADVHNDNVVRQSTESFQGHVTTDSESVSSSDSASAPVDPLVDTGDCEQSFGKDSLIDSVSSMHESMNAPSKKIQSTDLMHFSVKLLKLYVSSLNTEIMQQSDQLVQLLAERDELVMLREASDDFVILLCLLHQRRARASRAALKSTVRSLIRPPRSLPRFGLPWFTRKGATTCGCRATSQFTLNSSNSEQYFDSLHLDSKLRRPMGQPIVTRQSEPRTIMVRDTDPTGLPSIPSTDHAKKRLAQLRDLCETLEWPDNQPELSQSLSLKLPFIAGQVHTLCQLRVINQILYGTLLEHRNTGQLVKAYRNDIHKSSEINTWISRNSIGL